MAELTGADLLAKIDELKPAPESEIAIACGYASANGKARLSAFKDAHLAAHGLSLSASTSAKGGRAGRTLSFQVTAGAKGQITLAGGYGTLVGIEPGGAVQIQHVGNVLLVHPAGVVPVFRDEPVPAAAVITYDSAPVAVAA